MLFYKFIPNNLFNRLIYSVIAIFLFSKSMLYQSILETGLNWNVEQAYAFYKKFKVIYFLGNYLWNKGSIKSFESFRLDCFGVLINQLINHDQI